MSRISEVCQNELGTIRAKYDPQDRAVDMDIRVGAPQPRKHQWTPGEWFCALVVATAAAWLVAEVLPGFFAAVSR